MTDRVWFFRVPQLFSFLIFLVAILGVFRVGPMLTTYGALFIWFIPNVLAGFLLWVLLKLLPNKRANCFEQHLKRYGRELRWRKRKAIIELLSNGKWYISVKDKDNFVSCGEYVFIWGINLVYDFFDFPLQLIRSCHEYKVDENRAKSEFSMNSWIDFVVVASASISGILLWFLDQNNDYLLTFFAGYFVWRIWAIAISKLRDITSINIASRKRTIGIYLVNIIDLVFCYSYLYLYFDAVDKSTEHFKLDAIIYSLKIFTTQGIDDLMITHCGAQKVLIISQMAVFIILFIMVITNIFGLKEEKKGI